MKEIKKKRKDKIKKRQSRNKIFYKEYPAHPLTKKVKDSIEDRIIMKIRMYVKNKGLNFGGSAM